MFQHKTLIITLSYGCMHCRHTLHNGNYNSLRVSNAKCQPTNQNTTLSLPNSNKCLEYLVRSPKVSYKAYSVCSTAVFYVYCVLMQFSPLA